MPDIRIPDLSEARTQHRKMLASILENAEGSDLHHYQKHWQYSHGLGPWLYAYALRHHGHLDIVFGLEKQYADLHRLLGHAGSLAKEGNENALARILGLIRTLEAEMEPVLDEISALLGPEEVPAVQLQNRFESLAEGSPMLILIAGPGHEAIYLNSTWTKSIGRDMQQLLGTGWLEAIHPDDLPVLHATLAQLSEDHTETQCELRMADAGGRLSWWLMHAKCVGNCERGFVASFLDISIRKQLEFENQIKSVVLDRCELIIGISFMGDNPEPLYNNQYTLDRLGWKDNKGRTLLDAIYPDDRERVLALLPDMLANGGGCHEIRLWNEVTSEPYWVQWNVWVINEPGGGLPLLLATISPDITERKQQQALLEVREKVLMNAVEIAELGTWEIDLVRHEVHLSPRNSEIVGTGAVEISLEQLSTYIVDSDQKIVFDAIMEAQQPGRDGRFEAEFRIIHGASRERRVLRSIGQTTYDSRGAAVAISGITQDITVYYDNQKALESQVTERTRQLDDLNHELEASNDMLQRTNVLLSRSNQELNRFAYVASHDLQEPLRKIQQFASRLAMETTGTSEKTRDYAHRMKEAARRMTTLIDDLLTLSRVSSDTIEQQDVALDEVLAQVLTDLDVTIRETRAVLRIDPLPRVRGNATQLGQLFQNLISNAIKFSKKEDAGLAPEITIECKALTAQELPKDVRPTQSAASYYRIRVTDNGIGFDEMYLDRIFQVFQRLHGRSEYAGTGIGLAICAKVVENHGGAITASSRLGAGAMFEVYLPVGG